MKLFLKRSVILTLFLVFSCKSDYSELTHQINSHLDLASSIDNETGKMIGKSNQFVIMNDGWVESRLDLTTYFADETNDLLIHLDWIDENGHSFYKKKKLLSPTSPIINSAISIAPNLRKAGNYTLNIYAFREMVASKNFKLLSEFNSTKPIKETIKLSLKANNNTQKLKSALPKINQMKDAWLNASVKLKHKPKTTLDSLLYQLNWIDSKGEIFYKKRFSVSSKKKTSKIDCSIELSPNKKEIGNYKVQLLLFGKPITAVNFEIKPLLDVHKIKIRTIDFKTVKNKKETKTPFKIDDNTKLKVRFNLENTQAFGEKKQLQFKIIWIGTNGKHFYTKRFNFTPKEANKILKSSISITPQKRKAGRYKVQLYLFNELISEKAFNLN